MTSWLGCLKVHPHIVMEKRRVIWRSQLELYDRESLLLPQFRFFLKNRGLWLRCIVAITKIKLGSL